jgi:hypothetical protein
MQAFMNAILAAIAYWFDDDVNEKIGMYQM